jgi:lipopolysaccharide-induced tumor necrosis factor-alpha factor
MDYSQQQQQQQQQPQQGIPMVPQQPTPVYEKAPEYPQQQQQQVPMQSPPVHVQGHQFMTAMPLAALSRSPAPVDCPSCGARALTACSYQSGDNAQ